MTPDARRPGYPPPPPPPPDRPAVDPRPAAVAAMLEHTYVHVRTGTCECGAYTAATIRSRTEHLADVLHQAGLLRTPPTAFNG